MAIEPSCEFCGRTILKGEEVYEYVTPQGERLVVCALCRARAEGAGWIPAALAGAMSPESSGRSGRGRAIRERLRRMAARTRSAARAAQPAAEEPGKAAASEPPPPAAESPPTPEASKPPPPPDPAAAERERPPRRDRQQPPRAARRPEPTREPALPRRPRRRQGPEAIMRRAVDRFNESEEPRKVAGLIRSLGIPRAAVQPDPGRQLALVTVAWELSWYQWEVSADPGDGPVQEIAKGKEVSELAEEARAWNAAVTEDGSLRLRTAATRPGRAATEA